MPRFLAIVDSREHHDIDRGVVALRRAWMDEGTARFDAEVRRLRDPELGEDSALPGWTRAHVVTHVARNADALSNLLTWARTGVETPMYASTERRASDIEAGAGRAPDVLRADLADAERRFSSAVAALADDRWASEVRTQTGRVITAAEVPWMRCREVWVHAVDLGTGVGFGDCPPAFVEAFLDEVTPTLGARADCDSLEIVAADASRSWSIGDPGERHTIVEGTAPELLAWAIGRSPGATLTCSTGAVPTLAPWL